MSEIVGVDFVSINSSLFSAQSRPRYYWTNIDFPSFPKMQCNENLENIIEEKVEENFYFNSELVNNFLSEKEIIERQPTQDGIIKLFDIPKEIINDHERQRRIYSPKGKSPTILARADTTKVLHNGKIRKLSPLECERLQKIPDNYTAICSNTQRYKMIGNAFTVDVIAHFLKGLKNTEYNFNTSKYLLKPKRSRTKQLKFEL